MQRETEKRQKGQRKAMNEKAVRLSMEALRAVSGGQEKPDLDWSQVPEAYQEQWDDLFSMRYTAEKNGDREAYDRYSEEFTKLTQFLMEKYSRGN